MVLALYDADKWLSKYHVMETDFKSNKLTSAFKDIFQ